MNINSWSMNHIEKLDKQISWEDLDRYVLREIISHLSSREILLNLQIVCKSWRTQLQLIKNWDNILFNFQGNYSYFQKFHNSWIS